MAKRSSRKSDDRPPAVPLWALAAGGVLLLMTAVAAPFYSQAMSGLIWAGQTIKALCGW